MTKNVGKIDRIARIVLGVILAYLDYSGTVTGGFSWLLSVVAVILILTAVLSFCPLYTLLGMNTCSTSDQ